MSKSKIMMNDEEDRQEEAARMRTTTMRMMMMRMMMRTMMMRMMRWKDRGECMDVDGRATNDEGRRSAEAATAHNCYKT